MTGAFTAEERHALGLALAEGETPACPACGAALSQRPVPPSQQVSYVRRRVWLLCPSCKRTGAVDVREQKDVRTEKLRGDGPP